MLLTKTCHLLCAARTEHEAFLVKAGRFPCLFSLIQTKNHARGTPKTKDFGEFSPLLIQEKIERNIPKLLSSIFHQLQNSQCTIRSLQIRDEVLEVPTVFSFHGLI